MLKFKFTVTSFEMLAALLLCQVNYLITLSFCKNRVLTRSIVSIFGFFFQLGRSPLTCKKINIVLTELLSVSRAVTVKGYGNVGNIRESAWITNS